MNCMPGYCSHMPHAHLHAKTFFSFPSAVHAKFSSDFEGFEGRHARRGHVVLAHWPDRRLRSRARSPASVAMHGAEAAEAPAVLCPIRPMARPHGRARTRPLAVSFPAMAHVLLRYIARSATSPHRRVTRHCWSLPCSGERDRWR